MLEKNNMISIIVPIYNIEQYLAECIESLIKQTHRNIQIILVDDGSTDNSGLICDQYAECDDRIEVIHQKNKGLVEARKAGLRIAKGTFVGFVDGDDYVESTMYEILLSNMLEENVDVVHSGYIVNKWGRERKVVQYDRKVVDKSTDLLSDILLSKSRISPSIWSKLFRKEIIQECYDEVNDCASYGEDLICLVSIAVRSYRVFLIDDAFYHYREREESISHIRKSGAYLKEFLLCENVKDVLLKHDLFHNHFSEYTVFTREHLLVALQKDSDNNFAIQKYVFPNPELLQHKKIVILGAGKVGRDFYSQICRYTNCQVVAWIDNYPEKCHYEFIDVESPEIICNIVFDIIVIAALEKKTYEEMRDSLSCYNIPNDKMIWIKPNRDI